MSVTNSLPGPDSHFISLGLAAAMTAKYRAERENILASNFKNQGILALSETFNRNALDTLLATEGCAGIRLYYGMDDALKVHAVLVAVTEDNADILPAGEELLMTTGGGTVLAELGQRCPDLCPPPSPVNTP